MTFDDHLTIHLETFLTDHKKALVEEVLNRRTRHATVVVENVYQNHNASAILRTADCFGIQDIHIIENNNEYNVNPDIALGSNKWLTLHHYNNLANNTLQCIEALKGKGYKIVATSPRGSISINEVDMTDKTAILFGSELTGLSDMAIENADYSVYIPMYGFTESFNISVSAALTLSKIREKLEVLPFDFRITEEEKKQLKLEWYKAIIRKSEMIVERFKNEFKQ